MTIHFGTVPAGSVLPIHFGTYNSAGASVTLTGLAVTDVEIYKGTTVTQRASDAGIALIDTDGIDIDGITGAHGFSIDLGDDTDAGFYAAGSFFNVWVSAVTIDSQTVNFLAATFRIAADPPTAAAIADAVWDEDLPTDHTTVDSAGFLVANTFDNVDDAPTIASTILATDFESDGEAGVSVAEGLRVMSAALAGKLSGAGTGTETVRSILDAKDRIVYTVDDQGNRTAVVTDLT
jgi:hypothetical protein